MRNSDRQKLLGTWEVSLEMNDDEVSQMTGTENPWLAGLGRTLARTVQAEMEMEFRSDDTFTLSRTTL